MVGVALIAAALWIAERLGVQTVAHWPALAPLTGALPWLLLLLLPLWLLGAAAWWRPARPDPGFPVGLIPLGDRPAGP